MRECRGSTNVCCYAEGALPNNAEDTVAVSPQIIQPQCFVCST